MQHIFRDFEIAVPDFTENTPHLIPFFYDGIYPVCLARVPVKRLLGYMIIFRPVRVGDELIYRNELTFFQHIN